MRILITAPDPLLRAGVTNFYQALRPHLPDDAALLTVGARKGERGTIAALCRLFGDTRTLHDTLRRTPCPLVVVNPSLDLKALLRDGLLLLVAKRHGARVIAFFHGWNERFERRMRSYFPWLFRLLFLRADAIIVLAAAFEAKLRAMGYTWNIFRETTVIDDTAIGSEAAIRARCAEVNRPARIVFLSRVEKAKGLYEAFETVRLLNAARPCELLIAGRGTELERAEQFVREHNLSMIRFLGYVDGAEKLRLLESADCFFLPSYTEGMPNAVLEAMAAGVPIVARLTGGLCDFFENGTMGYGTTGCAPKEFARLIGELLAEPERRLAISLFNRTYAAAHFTASDAASRLYEIFNRTAGLPER